MFVFSPTFFAALCFGFPGHCLRSQSVWWKCQRLRSVGVDEDWWHGGFYVNKEALCIYSLWRRNIYQWPLFQKKNLILDGVQRPFVWTILLWLKCKMRSFLEVSQNVLRFNFMKLNQTNMVFAWSFADSGALSDSLTDGPNHHWYHHVDTLLIFGMMVGRSTLMQQ